MYCKEYSQVYIARTNTAKQTTLAPCARARDSWYAIIICYLYCYKRLSSLIALLSSLKITEPLLSITEVSLPKSCKIFIFSQLLLQWSKDYMHIQKLYYYYFILMSTQLKYVCNIFTGRPKNTPWSSLWNILLSYLLIYVCARILYILAYSITNGNTHYYTKCCAAFDSRVIFDSMPLRSYINKRNINSNILCCIKMNAI